MPERKSFLLVGDILTCIEHIQNYTAALTFDAFSNNYMVVEACLYNIQVIGEAVSKLPEHIKQTEPAVPWPLIKGSATGLCMNFRYRFTNGMDCYYN